MQHSHKHKLHIVALDIPYPLDYGAPIDMYNRIRYLSEAGVDIYLHCFQYNGRQEATELNKWCKEVWYYPRKVGWKGLSPFIPYMIYSRRDKLLLKRLREIDAPILFEGVHCSLYMSDPALKNRVKIIRNHNIEHDYIRQLGNKEKNPIKKLYYYFESLLLKRYEHRLNDIQAFLPISTSDYDYFKHLYPTAKFSLTPPFHSYRKVMSHTGMGSYCLFHGNLHHPENREAVFYLLDEVFSKINTPLIIAGRNPGDDMIDACAHLPHCTLIANPDTEAMEQLIQDAQLQLMYTFQPTGMKTKLLIGMFYGRFILANEQMVRSTGLDHACIMTHGADEIRQKIEEYMPVPFMQKDIDYRVTALKERYDNATNAARIITFLPQ